MKVITWGVLEQILINKSLQVESTRHRWSSYLAEWLPYLNFFQDFSWAY